MFGGTTAAFRMLADDNNSPLLLKKWLAAADAGRCWEMLLMCVTRERKAGRLCHALKRTSFSHCGGGSSEVVLP